MKEETIVADKKGFPIISEELCSGCGLCSKKCPAGAISIINLPQELGKPLHQYGINAFRIFRIPTPKKGIIGLIGPNGIGKTTILKILSGNLVPNLNENADWAKVLEHFKGHEIQKYLKALSEGKTKLAYKPQDVQKIPEFFKGTAGNLLKKTDERKILKDVAEKLELKNCLEKKLNEISGGELQRVAIAATLCKEADFYFFDEPSSFLDIRQRMKTARVIAELGKEKCVFVVEHDLAVLDYLTDYVYVLYGKPGVYGIVSSIKNSRTGINEFLNGFLKAENTRIRNYPVVFEPKPPAEEWKGKKKIYYEGFEKAYPDFVLKANAGELRKGEVVGIVGQNAIGKSTFVKVLAGIEKATKGQPNLNLKISYKPQYVEIDFDGAVHELIMKEKDVDSEIYESEIKRMIEDLLLKSVKTLSGGELQRLSIALALSKKCDVCLLDEPSAFLDIEQRFHLAKIIKRITEKKEITTVVVDHDVVFEDSVANRLMVFSGTPGREGFAKAAIAMADGMNIFLKELGITFRRDEDTKRPRINKEGSQKDTEQKRKGEYYYAL
jgi:ATP-binding cassette subfamily E protein 1